MSLLEKVSNLAKRRGFVYPSSEIYGGIAGMWDFGPLGTELTRNIKNEFWRTMVQTRDDVVGIDASIIMNPRVWEASGHTEAFTDPLVDCKKCKRRFRADHLEDKGQRTKDKGQIVCPECGGEFTSPRQFNLLVETFLGSIEGEKERAYLRGEITQGVHTNFKQILDSTRVKIPFGVTQIGKAFRNEITPGGFIFRCREFEQMELQYYVKPDKKESQKVFEEWKEKRLQWYLDFGFSKKNLRFKEHAPDERAHYAQAAFDIEYNLEGEWKEMEGVHHRGDWDLRRHQEYSKKDMTYYDEETKERYLPYIIETSAGVGRVALFALCDAYEEEILPPLKRGQDDGKQETRTVLKLHPKLAPYKVAVFPLLANKPQLVKLARSIYDDLRKDMMVAWDERGNIGKRYRAQDEAGTPYCVTVDFESLEKEDVTVRDRDSMKQKRVKVGELREFLLHSFR
ncbi:MAG: glycine--tRNA ligase [bacterium]|nr:glycine--tRNA ligase [bacterium]